MKYKHKIIVDWNHCLSNEFLRWMINLNWGYQLVVQMADMNETHTLIERMYFCRMWYIDDGDDHTWVSCFASNDIHIHLEISKQAWSTFSNNNNAIQVFDVSQIYDGMSVPNDGQDWGAALLGEGWNQH